LSIAYPTRTRGRRAKTNRIDGEALLRALLAYKRGEPRVCAMVKVPAPEEEDRRRLCRERIADNDATLCQEVLNIAVAQSEPEIEPDGMPDGVRWKSMPSIRNWLHGSL
jgi:hypothetical protein